MRVLYPGRIEIWKCWFSGGRKTGGPGEKPLEQGENQQETQPTCGTAPEWNPGAIPALPTELGANCAAKKA